MRAPRHAFRTMVIIALAPALALSAGAVSVGAGRATAPHVLTSKAAYLDGEDVVLSGYGFLPFEVVTLHVMGAGVLVRAPWTAIADAHGAIDALWQVDELDPADVDMVVTAIGQSSGTATKFSFRRLAAAAEPRSSIDGLPGLSRGDAEIDGPALAGPGLMLLAGNYNIDGAVPDGGVYQFNDPYGSVSELGPLNSTNTKLLAISGATSPMFNFTNPNAQVDLRKIWMATNVVAGDAWLYFAWERDSNSGSGVIAFEFQQSPRPAACDYAQTDQIDSPAGVPSGEAQLIASCNPWVNRQPGDFLIVWDSSGKAINIIKRTFYLDPGNGKLALDAGVILSAVDAAAAVSADKFRGEAAINLSKTVFPANPTSCFSIANIIPGTVTGNSDTADYKDTVLAEFASRVAVSNCGQVRVTKVTEPTGGTGSFPYTLARTNGQALRFVGDGGQLSLAETLVADLDFDVHFDLIAGSNYTLAEGSVGPAWGLLSISCGGTDVTSGGTFAVPPSVVTDCTITNKLQNGTLIVRKVVTNDDGGTATCGSFSFSVNGETATSFEADCQNEISVDTTVPYTVTEPAVAGYATSYDNCSSVQVPPGGSATCTVTNNDRGPSLRLVKSVTNDNGGAGTPSAWQLTANGTGGFTDAGNSTTFHNVVAGVEYVLSESSVSGYDFVSWSCDAGSFVAPNRITLGLNQQATCTVTNNDRKATPGVTTTERAILHDAASIAGIRPGAPAPAATVTFRLYSDATCTTQVGIAETVGIANGNATTVNGVLVTAPGTYYWRASYSGDAFNAAFATACGSEVTTIGF